MVWYTIDTHPVWAEVGICDVCCEEKAVVCIEIVGGAFRICEACVRTLIEQIDQ